MEPTESSEVKHYQINGKYRIVIERASTKGIDGFKVEVNGDTFSLVEIDAETLYTWAKEKTKQEGING